MMMAQNGGFANFSNPRNSALQLAGSNVFAPTINVQEYGGYSQQPGTPLDDADAMRRRVEVHNVSQFNAERMRIEREQREADRNRRRMLDEQEQARIIRERQEQEKKLMMDQNNPLRLRKNLNVTLDPELNKKAEQEWRRKQQQDIDEFNQQQLEAKRLKRRQEKELLQKEEEIYELKFKKNEKPESALQKTTNSAQAQLPPTSAGAQSTQQNLRLYVDPEYVAGNKYLMHMEERLLRPSDVRKKIEAQVKEQVNLEFQKAAAHIDDSKSFLQKEILNMRNNLERVLDSNAKIEKNIFELNSRVKNNKIESDVKLGTIQQRIANSLQLSPQELQLQALQEQIAIQREQQYKIRQALLAQEIQPAVNHHYFYHQPQAQLSIAQQELEHKQKEQEEYTKYLERALKKSREQDKFIQQFQRQDETDEQEQQRRQQEEKAAMLMRRKNGRNLYLHYQYENNDDEALLKELEKNQSGMMYKSKSMPEDGFYYGSELKRSVY